jgi:hypothetical protein
LEKHKNGQKKTAHNLHDTPTTHHMRGIKTTKYAKVILPQWQNDLAK